ncbi:MAG TPA: hypothetical protein PLN56_11960, partial [Methanoregulaceae archaeon]|nr:hypothetical protein [Methanoregulaceae archaeon]
MNIQGFIVVFGIICLIGLVIADDPIGITRETQGISTVTHVVVYGTFTNNVEAVWVSSSQDLRNNPPLKTYSDDWIDPFSGLGETGKEKW